MIDLSDGSENSTDPYSLRISMFGACSAFTHVKACTLAESPSDPLHRKLRQLRCLRCRLDFYRVERTSSRAGVSPAEDQCLSRRTVTPTRGLFPSCRSVVQHRLGSDQFCTSRRVSTWWVRLPSPANFLILLGVNARMAGKLFTLWLIDKDGGLLGLNAF